MARMDALAERLDARLRVWRPDTADRVRERVAELIEAADQDTLDLARARLVEQEVLDLLDRYEVRIPRLGFLERDSI